jgi:hypothetical protein
MPTSLILRILATLFAMMPVTQARSEPTDITVRVIARDAKFIGSSMGGALITVRDAHTGDVLASGLTEGGTGNTGLIMHKDADRRDTIVDDSAAAFTVTLDLDEPRLIEVEAYGPQAQPQGAHRIVSSQWVVPGRHLSGGNGWMLEMPGFVVDVLSPPAHSRLGSVDKVEVRVNVIMMCGCPIEPDGLWDANRYEVAATVKIDGTPAGKFDLAFAGETSQFSGVVPISAPGVYDVTVYAYDPANGNTGLDRTTFFVR